MVGDWIADTVAENQPVKLAAMEGLFDTGRGCRSRSAASSSTTELQWALEIPWGLSLLVTHDPDGEVIGLQSVPPDLRPPVNVVHLAYNTMVGIGSALMLLALWLRLDVVAARTGSRARRGSCARRRCPARRRWLAMETGWITTEVGRQPFIVYGILRTADAVSPAPGIALGFFAVAADLRRADRAHRVRAAPPGPLARRARRRQELEAGAA